jgi:hypothetical protein
VKPPRPEPVRKKPACSDVFFYSLRLREDRRRPDQKTRANIFDYIPVDRVPMIEMSLAQPWSVKDAQAIAFLVKIGNLEAWDAILLPDHVFLLMLPAGEGKSIIETSEDRNVRGKWKVMACPGVEYDVTVCGADDASASEWIELYFGDVTEAAARREWPRGGK